MYMMCRKNLRTQVVAFAVAQIALTTVFLGFDTSPALSQSPCAFASSDVPASEPMVVHCEDKCHCWSKCACEDKMRQMKMKAEQAEVSTWLHVMPICSFLLIWWAGVSQSKLTKKRFVAVARLGTCVREDRRRFKRAMIPFAVAAILIPSCIYWLESLLR